MQLITQRGFAARSGHDAESEIATWGLPAWQREQDALLLAASVRRHERDLSPAEVRRLLLDDPSALAEVLPTFAAAVSTPSGGTRVTTDYLGFRHIFFGHRDGAGIVSTSSHACAVELGAGLDLEAVAVQSSLGWQLDQRTLFEGVDKLAPGGIATLEDGEVTLSSYRRSGPGTPVDLEHAVSAAADVLRTYLTSYLEDHPDAGLQLTGGQDSRLLLSAIPASRRRGLRVVTLGRPGEPDVDIAAGLAARFGMRHELLSLSGLEDLDPAGAYELCLDAARRLDYSADPIAHAALSFAEARSEPGPRISGLGGEVARGFYYLGMPTGAPVSPRRAERLARWRMFVNEAVPMEALDPSFAGWARDFATHEVVRVLTETGRPWMAATDELYLAHRMQRWGGVTETAVCLDRDVVNPMLDDRFISIATALEPLDKRNSRFLSRLQLELDAELGSLPLDGRPRARGLRPSFGAELCSPDRRHPPQGAPQGGSSGSVVRPGHRPVARSSRARSSAHWRDNPAALEPLEGLAIFRKGWLDAVVTGEQTPPSSAVALVVNLIGAIDRP